MRRAALLGLTLLVSGCNGLFHYYGDTSGLALNRNQPLGDGENLRRARGQVVDIPPLRTEPGDVWPGPPPPEPTLNDLERQQNSATPPNLEPGQAPPPPPSGAPGQPAPQGNQQGGQQGSQQGQPPRRPRGSSTPPGSVAPGLPPEVAVPIVPGVPAPAAPRPGTTPRTYQAPGGPLLGTPTNRGYDSVTTPQGGNGGIAIPNGNGTSTIIAPDGSVTTVPTPR